MKNIIKSILSWVLGVIVALLLLATVVKFVIDFFKRPGDFIIWLDPNFLSFAVVCLVGWGLWVGAGKVIAFFSKDDWDERGKALSEEFTEDNTFTSMVESAIKSRTALVIDLEGKKVLTFPYILSSGSGYDDLTVTAKVVGATDKRWIYYRVNDLTFLKKSGIKAVSVPDDYDPIKLKPNNHTIFAMVYRQNV